MTKATGNTRANGSELTVQTCVVEGLFGALNDTALDRQRGRISSSKRLMSGG